MATPLLVRQATKADIPQLAAVLARAFVRDPFFSWIAGDAPERNDRMRAGWGGILRYASARLAETYTTDDLSGVAIWLPPGHQGPAILDGLRLAPAMVRLVGWRRLRSVVGALDVLERRRRHHVPRLHYYLSTLGVDPDRQGQGIGTTLTQPILDRCDRDHVTAYLETATARNVLLYERHRFEVVEELTLPGADVSGWLMVRSPAEAAERP